MAGVAEHVAYLEEMSEKMGPQRVERWTTLEANAQRKRREDIKGLHIYDRKPAKREHPAFAVPSR